MASTINASTSPAAIVQTADGTGILALQTAGTTAVTIDASQNVGIGTTSPTTKLQVNGGMTMATANWFSYGTDNTFYSDSSYGLVIKAPATSNFIAFRSSNDTERMRIDSSGNLLTGTTNATTSAGVGGKYLASATAPTYSLVGSASGTDASFVLYSTGAAAYRFYVQYDGKIYATNTVITGISDQRLKENIVDLGDGLDAVMALKPRKFDWKEGKGKNIKGDRGFIAQEFETVFPDMIDEWKDTPPEGEEPYKAVRADLIPVLVKAIQEQQALITSLTARITALEGA